MIYLIQHQDNEYKITYFHDPDSKKVPVQEYMESLEKKDQSKIVKYIDFLQKNKGGFGQAVYQTHSR